jgi:hypothetical protein
MSVSIRAVPAAHARWPARRPRTTASAGAGLALALLVAGCGAAPPAPFAGPHPADPRVRVPATAYRSTIAPYVGQRPVDPGSWREQNERVAPAPRP